MHVSSKVLQPFALSCSSFGRNFALCSTSRSAALSQPSSSSRGALPHDVGTARCHKPARGGQISLRAAEHEGPEFVEINSESAGLDGQSESTFGPLAILLIGYKPREVDLVREYLNEIEADMVRVIICTAEMAEQRLCDVLESEPRIQPKEQLSFNEVNSAPQTARRMLIMSGMTSEEVLSIVYGYRQQELPETVMAAAVPASYERKVSTLVDDVYGDHEYMMAKEKAASN